MAEEPDRAKLEELERRIAEAKQPEVRKHHSDEHYSQAHLAWRMVIELVAGMGIGFGIGYGLDALAGTLPLFLVVFTLLGFAAGIRTMMRTAKEAQDKKIGADAPGNEGD
ncbi:MAG: AtpZ/AtpI family protein [Brevirhabdus sp.]